MPKREMHIRWDVTANRWLERNNMPNGTALVLERVKDGRRVRGDTIIHRHKLPPVADGAATVSDALEELRQRLITDIEARKQRLRLYSPAGEVISGNTLIGNVRKMASTPRRSQPEFQKRTWQETSDAICQVQAFPPGTHIVLLDKGGTVVKRPPKVTSGDFGTFPVSWPVKAFLLEGVGTCVRDDLSEWNVELRDHEGESIDEALTLRRVREMQGSSLNPAFDSQDDLLCDLESELEDALGIFDPDVDRRIAPDPEIFLKGLLAFILKRYEIDALETALQFFDLDVRQKRDAEAHQWDHLILDKA